MDIKSILHRVDHTLLRVDCVWDEVKALCDEALYAGTASVCIPPCYVKSARDYLGGRIPVCTVIGFPNGYATTAVKCYEAAAAAADGADELDMVINIGDARSGRYDAILGEIRAVRAACRGRVLKVIVETCLLTGEQKSALCRVVSESGADFIKTSTGFAGGGATPEDIAMFRSHCAPALKIKAAGGIKTFEQAERLIELGADRIGASRLVSLAKEKYPEVLP